MLTKGWFFVCFIVHQLT